MLVTILSDIHGNLEALNEVLAWVDRIRPDRVISLGDNIGYGPDPNGVMEEICRRKIPSVKGNHEMAVVDPAFLVCFNPVAIEAVTHTINHLSRPFREAMARWPKRLVLEELSFVHGVPPASPFVYLFQLSDRRLASKIKAMDQWVCFTGHTHDLELIDWDGHTLTHQALGQGETVLSRQKKYIVNAGSVGQPRDGDPCAKALSFDTETGRLTVEFIPYDFHATAAKIREAGIPAIYAEKLSKRL